MKTSIHVVFAIIIFGALFSACGYKKDQPKTLTAKEALDTCFIKVADFTVNVDTTQKDFFKKFLKNKESVFLTINHYLGHLASLEKTKGGYKRVFIYQLKYCLTNDKLYAFVKNHGNFLTIQDMTSLYEQHKEKLPTYVWILGGDYSGQYIPVFHFFDPIPPYTFGVAQFQIFSNPGINYKWQKTICVAYWDDITAE